MLKAPALVALLAPLGVMAGALAWLGRELPDEPTTEEIAIQAEIAAHGGDVVLLGNSTTASDIDGRRLMRALGAKGQVTLVRLYGSDAPIWLAALEGQFAMTGQHPRVVIVPGTLQWLLAEKPANAKAAARAASFVPENAASRTAMRVLGREGSGTLDRAARARTVLKDALFGRVRDLAVGDHERAVAALDALLGERAIFRKSGPARIVPVVEREADATARPGGGPGLLPDLAAVAHGMGARFVVVRLPDRPTEPASAALQGREAAVVEALNALGAGWVNLADVQVGSSLYADHVHMTREGRDRLTDALVAGIERLDPLGEEPMPKAPPPLRTRVVERRGDWPAEVPARVSSTPAEEWIPPAGVLALRLDEVPAGAVVLSASTLGGEPPNVSVDGRSFAATAVHGPSGEAAEWDTVIDAPGAAFTLRIAAAPTGWVRVRGIAVVDGDRRTQVLGTAFANSVRVATQHWKYDAAPPELPVLALDAATDGDYTGALGDLAQLSPAAMTEAGARGCSPLRLEWGQGPLPAERPAKNGEKWTIDGVTARVPAAPAVLSLDEKRRCGGGQWLYPGASATSAGPAPDLARLRFGVARARVTARVFGTPSGTLELSLAGKKAPLGSYSLDVATLAAGPVELELPAIDAVRLGPGVRATFANTGSSWVLVESVELLEPSQP